MDDQSGSSSDSTSDEIEAFTTIQNLIQQINLLCGLWLVVLQMALHKHIEENFPDIRGPNPFQTQVENINRLVRDSDTNCLDNLRMDRRCFMHLCQLLEVHGQLSHSKHVIIEEKVAMFLLVLGHHDKIRRVKFTFIRSGQTVCKYVNEVLKSVLRVQGNLLSTPDPIDENCTNDKWRLFQNCLGALDGTYIRVRVAAEDTPRFRTRKGDIATNVLGVCTPNLQFIYVLPGWEGSAADCRVLRDAVNRPSGLKVPHGFYYLVDAGYTNGEGFLAPYRGQRYHLKEWDGHEPVNYKEYFNMKHAQARNVIERCFGILKMRWAILRSPSYYPIVTQNRIISCCCLLHNFIRQNMHVDPMENIDLEEEEPDLGDDFLGTVETSAQWTQFREDLAMQMYNEWLQY